VRQRARQQIGSLEAVTEALLQGIESGRGHRWGASGNTFNVICPGT